MSHVLFSAEEIGKGTEVLWQRWLPDGKAGVWYFSLLYRIISNDQACIARKHFKDIRLAGDDLCGHKCSESVTGFIDLRVHFILGSRLNYSCFLSLKGNLSTFREAQVEWGPGCLSWLSQLAQVGSTGLELIFLLFFVGVAHPTPETVPARKSSIIQVL